MYSESKEYVSSCKFYCFIWIVSKISLLLNIFSSSNILTFFSFKIILIIDFVFCHYGMLYSVSIYAIFMRVFKHLPVWPTYDASQSRQSILCHKTMSVSNNV